MVSLSRFLSCMVYQFHCALAKMLCEKTVCHASPMYLCGSMSRFCNPINKSLTHLKNLKCLSSLLHSPAAHWAAQQSTEITVSLTINFENQKGHHKWHSWNRKVHIILIHIHPHLEHIIIQETCRQ